MEVFIFLKSSTREQDRHDSYYSQGTMSPLVGCVDTSSTKKSSKTVEPVVNTMKRTTEVNQGTLAFGNEFSKNSTRTFWKGLKSYSELNRKCSKLNSKMEAFLSCSPPSHLNRNGLVHDYLNS